MDGKSHIVSGLAVYGTTYELVTADTNNKIFETIQTTLATIVPMSTNTTEFVVVLAGVIFGAILPDIDKSNATISHLLHFSLPIRHRTWTHTLWFWLLFAIPAYFTNGYIHLILTSVAFGIFTHLFCDAFSPAGTVWLYPLMPSYRMYYADGTAIPMRKHHLTLYRGKISKLICCILLVITLVFTTMTLHADKMQDPLAIFVK